MLERHKLLMGRTQDRAGQNNGSIGVFWRSFNGIIGHIRYMFRGLKITHNHEHSSLYIVARILQLDRCVVTVYRVTVIRPKQLSSLFCFEPHKKLSACAVCGRHGQRWVPTACV